MKGYILYIILLSSLLFTGCNREFTALQKSDDIHKKFDGAKKYYEEKDYYRASILLEDLLPLLRGSEKGESCMLMYAYCSYYVADFIMSAHYFKSFYTTYARSEKAEEAYYMYAYSLYNQSPFYSLDQTSTLEAIAAIQLFINKYPKSEHKEDATKIIDELQLKLERKAAENAKLYYQLSNYKSAIIAFDNFRDDYPDSEFVEEIEFLKIECQYNLAIRSINKKQEERLREAIEFYLSFVDKYPGSSYLKRAEAVYERCQSELKKIEKTT